MLLSRGKKSLFYVVASGAKSLLLRTMPAALYVEHLDQKPAEHSPLEGPFFYDTPSFPASVDSPMSNYTLRTPFPASASQRRPSVSKKRKKKPKKVPFISDGIPDENKTVQYNAIEALMAKCQHLSANEDLDLTGAEDPVILYAVISSLSHVQAYKELSKFRRRLQFLEMMVHLVTATLARGHVDKIIDWLGDALQWLSKRNEMLLSSRSRVPAPPGHNQVRCKPTGSILGMKMSNPLIARSSVVELPSSMGLKACPSFSLPTPQVLAMGSPNKLGKTLGPGLIAGKTSLCSTVPPKKITYQYDLHKLALKKVQLLTAHAVDVSQEVKITREDLDVKSTYVLMTQLSEMWRTHKCRYTATCAHAYS